MSYNLKPQRYNAYDLASYYLRVNGLPDTLVSRHMLAAWFMAESKRVGTTDIIVYNNNPLNMTQSRPDMGPYHQFNGIDLYFKNFDTPQAGAKDWYRLLGVRASYRAIREALRVGDVAAFTHAISASPWGTSGALVRSVYQSSVANGATGKPIAGTSPLTDKPMIGAWFFGANGAPLVQFEQGHVLTEADVNSIMDKLEKSGIFAVGGGGPAGFFLNPIATEIAKGDFRNILMKHVGEPWTEALVAKIGVETQTKAVQEKQDIGNPLGASDVLTNISNFLDPAKMVPRFVHIGAILLGGFLVLWGAKIVLGEAGVSGSPVEGAPGGSEKIVERDRYPVLVESNDVGDLEVSNPAPARPPLVGRRRVRQSGPSILDDYVDNTKNNPGSVTVWRPES